MWLALENISITVDSIIESRRLEDTIRDWGDRYGEKFTDTESSEENRCLERADRGLPEQRHQRQSLAWRKWHQYRQLL